MSTDEIREKYLDFFKKKGHIEITPSPLVIDSDPTTLFTSSGMQQLAPYLKGEKHSKGKRLVDIQPSIRMQDLDEVADNRHFSFFEMLGNWSLGDYFKEEQLPWIWEFLTKELKLPKQKLYITVFEGNDSVPKDLESYDIWKSLGVQENHISFFGVEKNWWSRSGTPDEMPIAEIGGPDSEIFFDFDGKFLEIGNSVFIQYKKNADRILEELPQKNVDFGGGLERITAALNNDPDVFKTDIYWPTIEKIETITDKKYKGNEKDFRIIADHLRASESLINAGVVPSNKMHGYVLRRLIRRMAIKLDKVNKITNNKIIVEELNKFKVSLDKGLKEIKKIEKITGKIAFDLYQSYGFPLELTVELFKDKGQEVDLKEFRKEFEKHKEASRSTSKGMFRGGLEDHSQETTKLHTATHLLHAALRKVLGDAVSQKGSHITAERLRFDFSYPEKLTDEQIDKVFNLINKKIEEDLPITFIETTPEEAIKKGALHFFAEKYGERVKVYKIGEFSHEICGGPHVTSTKLVGDVRMIKQEKIGSGIIRIYVGLSSKT